MVTFYGHKLWGRCQLVFGSKNLTHFLISILSHKIKLEKRVEMKNNLHAHNQIFKIPQNRGTRKINPAVPGKIWEVSLGVIILKKHL